MNAPSRRRVLALCAAALPGGLAGCSGLLPGPGAPPQLFNLTPKDNFPADLPKVSWQLLVDVPAAPAALDTERIALARSPTSIDYFAGAAWSDRAPLLIQALLVESFENCGKITAIARETLGLRADYLLKPEIRHFEAEYDAANGPPLIRVRLNAKLVKMPDREIVAQKTFETTARPAQNLVPAIVDAFNAALHDAMGQIVAWTLTAGSAA